LLKVADALDRPMVYFLTDYEYDEVGEEDLLMHYRKLNKKGKKLAVELTKIINSYL